MLRRFGSRSIHGDPLGLAVLLVCVELSVAG